MCMMELYEVCVSPRMCVCWSRLGRGCISDPPCLLGMCMLELSGECVSPRYVNVGLYEVCMSPRMCACWSRLGRGCISEPPCLLGKLEWWATECWIGTIRGVAAMMGGWLVSSGPYVSLCAWGSISNMPEWCGLMGGRLRCACCTSVVN